MTFIKSPKDFWAGILYIAFGTFAIVVALNYPIGSAGRMGPGYFPRALGIILIALGLILSLRALKLHGTPPVFGVYKPILVITASVVVFDSELTGWGGCKPEIDHADADGLEAGNDAAVEHGARDAAVPTHHDRFRAVGRGHPSPER